MTDDDRIALINDTTTIDSLDYALIRAERNSRDLTATIYDNYPVGATNITATDWQRHWDESDHMFDAMWNGT
jgi:hypothetical protein